METPKTENYKGFNLEFFICKKGFNQYTIYIRKKTKDNKYYFFKQFSTYTNKKHIAKKEVINYIDNLKSFKWCWNGIKKFNSKTDKINEIEVLKINN